MCATELRPFSQHTDKTSHVSNSREYTDNAEAALAGARVTVWTWDPVGGEFSVRTRGRGPLEKLDGQWKLDAFVDQLDGLDQVGFRDCFEHPIDGDSINLTVVMRDATRLHVLGSFSDGGAGVGLIIPAEVTVPHEVADLEAVFQPIVRLPSLELGGFEALARFWSAEGEILSPDEAIGRGGRPDWRAIAPAMIQQSLDLVSRMKQAGQDIFVQVNLSAVELGQPEQEPCICR